MKEIFVWIFYNFICFYGRGEAKGTLLIIRKMHISLFNEIIEFYFPKKVQYEIEYLKQS